MKLADGSDEIIGDLCFKGITNDGVVEIGYGIQPLKRISLAFRSKDTSLVKAFQAVKDKEVQGVITAGPTQATIIAAHLIIRRLKGMKRVALCPTLPHLGGKNRLDRKSVV